MNYLIILVNTFSIIYILIQNCNGNNNNYLVEVQDVESNGIE